jgi:hypothetical protein
MLLMLNFLQGELHQGCFQSTRNMLRCHYICLYYTFHIFSMAWNVVYGIFDMSINPLQVWGRGQGFSIQVVWKRWCWATNLNYCFLGIGKIYWFYYIEKVYWYENVLQVLEYTYLNLQSKSHLGLFCVANKYVKWQSYCHICEINY